MSKDMKTIMESWNKFVVNENLITEIDTDLQKFFDELEDNVEEITQDSEGRTQTTEIVASSALLFSIMTTGGALGALVEFILKKMKNFAKEEYRFDPEIETNEEKILEKAIKVVSLIKQGVSTLGLHTLAKFLLPKVGLFGSEEAKEKLDQVADLISLIIGIGGLTLYGYTSVIEAAAKGKAGTTGLISAFVNAFDISQDTLSKVLEIFDNASDLKQAIINSIKLIKLFMTGSS
jgi:hypothetical protein